jgi:tetratricopeptide (TPR) repeat protein
MSHSLESASIWPSVWPSHFYQIGGAILLGASLLLAGLFLSDWANFVWGDVAFVFVIAALPIGAVIASELTKRLDARFCFLLGIVFVVLPMLFRIQVPEIPLLVRWAAAVCCASGVLLVALSASWGSLSGTSLTIPREWQFLSLLILLIPTTIYSQVSIQREKERLGDLLDQSRLGEAYLVAGRLMKWDQNLRWRDRSVRDTTRELGQLVETLTRQVDSMPGQGESMSDQIARARGLAILGRTHEALEILTNIPIESLSASARNLMATIYETRQEWKSASGWYQLTLAGITATNSEPDSEETAEALRAWQGIGFNERKRGDLVSAEFAYQEMLKRSPDAQRHFLLGQFYEDTQRSMLARQHILRAIELDPDRYRVEGDRLLQKLVTGHFGCLQVFRRDQEAAFSK